MAVPILKINVDDEEFSKFQQAFANYQEQAEKQPAIWSSINNNIADSAGAASDMLAAIEAQTAQTMRLADAVASLEALYAAAAKNREEDDRQEDARADKAQRRRDTAMRGIRDYVKTVGSAMGEVGGFMGGGQHVGSLASSLGGVISSAGGAAAGGIGGLIKTIGGALGIFGAAITVGYGAADYAVDLRRRARGYGITAGQLQGAQTYLSADFDPERALSGIAQMEMSPAGTAQLAMMGVNGAKGNSFGQMEGVARHLRAAWQTYGGNLQVLNALGYGQLFDPMSIRRIGTESQADFDQEFKNARNQKGNSDSELKAMQSFKQAVDSASQALLTALTTPLAKFAPTMTDTINKMKDYLPQVTQDMIKFGEELKKIADMMGWITGDDAGDGAGDDASHIVDGAWSGIKDLFTLYHTDKNGVSYPVGHPPHSPVLDKGVRGGLGYWLGSRSSGSGGSGGQAPPGQPGRVITAGPASDRRQRLLAMFANMPFGDNTTQGLYRSYDYINSITPGIAWQMGGRDMPLNFRGGHHDGSEHYMNRAYDLRINSLIQKYGLTRTDIPLIKQYLRGKGYSVYDEGNHLHVGKLNARTPDIDPDIHRIGNGSGASRGGSRVKVSVGGKVHIKTDNGTITAINATKG